MEERTAAQGVVGGDKKESGLATSGEKPTNSAYEERKKQTEESAAKGLNMYGAPIRQPDSFNESGPGWSRSRNGVPSASGRPAMQGSISTQRGPTLSGGNRRVGIVAAVGASPRTNLPTTGTGLRTNNESKKGKKKKLTRAQRREEARIKHSDPSGAMGASKEASKEVLSLVGWLLFGISVTKDGLDILFNFLDGVGLAASGTGIGLVVGVPLMALSFVLSALLTLAIYVTNLLYFFLSFAFTAQQQTIQAQNESSARARTSGPRDPGVAIKAKIDAKNILSDSIRSLINRARAIFMRRLYILSITALIGMIPVLNIIPEATIGFFLSMLVGINMHKKGKK